jgi:selenocysteine lyase/cysteine desulfurase
VDISALRRIEFPWTERQEIVYLNHASTGPLPMRAQSALDAWAALRGEPWRITDEMQFDVMDRARRLAAQLIGARVSEIALTPNTSHGLNIASRCLPLEQGDVVVAPDREFPANVYPWMALEREGIQYRRVPCDADGLPDERALIAALDAPRVKVLALSWVSFATGYTFDLERLGRACRERGVYFVVDAIQGVGTRSLDVRAANVDILACGGQKWLLAPWGTGFAYVREELVRQLEPRQVGWMSVRGSHDFRSLLDYDLSWLDDARRFETGTLAYGDLAAFCASLELLHEVGIACIESHVNALLDRLTHRLFASGVRAITPSDDRRRAGILTIALQDAPRIHDRLIQKGVRCALREGGIRVSPYFYNTNEDIDRASELIARET